MPPSPQKPLGSYPRTRLRRNRRTHWSRRLVAENRLSTSDLMWPVFAVAGEGRREPVASMPGVDRLSIDLLVEAVGEAVALGIPAVAVFPSIEAALKTPEASEALNPDNLVCRVVRAIKAAHPEIGVICDVALDPFNSEGHDGLVQDGRVLNDETVALLCRQAVIQAQAGCDIVAPSDMMDGRVGAIRDALDAAGFVEVQIMSYAAKYASAFYGPFRDAVGSGAMLKGNKKCYQMDPANGAEAMREVALDIAEGADMLIVKPGLPYLDVLRAVSQTFGVPTFAYQVSGEYAMLKAAVANGWLDGEAALLEMLVCCKRAGAAGILSYAAIEVARLLRRG
ncbi:MAG: porphobilinogen synthase [Rhodospirillales bacterium]|nr:porphobilinogen synthase [Rhodospirillales bacterium]